MIRLPSRALPRAAQKKLHAYQGEIDGLYDYATRVEQARISLRVARVMDRKTTGMRSSRRLPGSSPRWLVAKGRRSYRPSLAFCPPSQDGASANQKRAEDAGGRRKIGDASYAPQRKPLGGMGQFRRCPPVPRPILRGQSADRCFVAEERLPFPRPTLPSRTTASCTATRRIPGASAPPAFPPRTHPWRFPAPRGDRRRFGAGSGGVEGVAEGSREDPGAVFLSREGRGRVGETERNAREDRGLPICLRRSRRGACRRLRRG